MSQVIQLRGCEPTRPVICATDASYDAASEYAGQGFITNSGLLGVRAFVQPRAKIGNSTVAVAELYAIAFCLETIRTGQLTILCDSTYVVKLLHQWQEGTFVMPLGYGMLPPTRKRHTLDALARKVWKRPELEIKWVKGHSRDPLNTGAHDLAALSIKWARHQLDEARAYRKCIAIAYEAKRGYDRSLAQAAK